MDTPGLDRRRHESALTGLARLNALSRVAAAIWRPIGDIAAGRRFKELSVCDLACGGGDVGIGLVRLAGQAGIRLRLTGYDRSPIAIDKARAAATAAGVEADFHVRDLFAAPLAEPFDVVTCTLFLHHLDECAAIEWLASMRRSARRLVVVDDLERRQIGYTAAHVFCRLLSRNDIVRLDGPQSVAAAFSRDELRRLAEAAALHGAVIRSSWPFRLLLTYEAVPIEQPVPVAERRAALAPAAG